VLTRFVEDSVFEIDSNLIENAIRPSAIEKKELVVHWTSGGWRAQLGMVHRVVNVCFGCCFVAVLSSRPR
jgi:hypothetical protein